MHAKLFALIVLLPLLALVGSTAPGVRRAFGEEERPAVPPLGPEIFERRSIPAGPWVGSLLPFGPRRLLLDYEEPVGKGRVKGAVEKALAWLAAHQCPDGRWSAQQFAQWCNGKQVVPKTRDTAYFSSVDPGVTGLALLAFLGAGHRPGPDGPYGPHVQRGLAWLASRQGEDGIIATHTGQPMVQAHAYATLALVEALGMTGVLELVPVVQRALDGIALARNPYFAWRYGIKPGDNDTSSTGDCVMPVFAARRINDACRRRGVEAPLKVDAETLDGVLAWVSKMTDPDYGRTGYIQRGGASSRYEQGGGCDAFPTDLFEGCTALGLLVRVWGGASGEEPEELNEMAMRLLGHNTPTWGAGKVDLYAWMYTALAMQQLAQRESAHRRAAETWYETLAEALVGSQRKDGDVCAAKGSWDPIGAWGWAGGRVYTTAMAALALLAPLRYSAVKDQVKTIAKLVGNRDLSVVTRRELLTTLAALDQGGALRGVLTTLLKKKDWHLRMVAAKLVPALKKPSKSLAKKLATLARRDPNAGVRVEALKALARLGPVGEKHGDVFVAALGDDDSHVFNAVIPVLWDSKALAEVAQPRLEQLLADSTRPDRSTLAASVLVLHHPEHPGATSMLRARIRTDSPAIAAALDRTLGWHVPGWAKVSDAQIEYALDRDLPVSFEGPLGQRFVMIPPGTFRMGSPETEPERLPDETLHEVTISKPFFLQIDEVPNGVYRQKEPKHRSVGFTNTPLDGSEQPVLRVSHVEARGFADWLSTRSDRWTFRLPTEAEWEYAARAGTSTRFWWGEDETKAGEYDNVADRTARSAWPRGFGQFVESTPQWRWFETDDDLVGTGSAALGLPNPWGLRALHGNVGEWCLDWKGDYPEGPVTDPTGPSGGSMRVVRGGSWVGSPQQCRAAMRGLLPPHLEPGGPCPWIGFRLVAEPR